jgi:hypothetical protein
MTPLARLTCRCGRRHPQLLPALREAYAETHEGQAVPEDEELLAAWLREMNIPQACAHSHHNGAKSLTPKPEPARLKPARRRSPPA